MPNILATNQSGGQPLYSGGAYSGQGTPWPVGSIILKWANNASGNAYVFLSGGLNFPLSGAALVTPNGFVMGPGDQYTSPALGISSRNIPQQSGQCSIFWLADAGASGQGRLSHEIY